MRKQQSGKGEKKEAKETRIDPDISRLQTELSEKLGAEVKIQHSANGKGSLTIKYNSSDELDGILERIK